MAEVEPKPFVKGTYYGERSPEGEWWWDGTGLESDDWVLVKEAPESESAPEPQAAPAPGTAVPGTTTIDALFTTLFATRSADLGAASYVWATPNSIIGTFPAGTTPTAQFASALIARFEARPVYPSKIAQ